MADLFTIHVIQRMQNGQRFWMLALMPPPPCHSRGTLFYTEKVNDRSSQQSCGISQRTLRDQLLDDENLISREFIAHISHDDLEGTDSFIECVQMAAGFEEKRFIKEALDNLQMVELIPAGISQRWSRLNIGHRSSAGTSRSDSPSGESVSRGSSLGSKSDGSNRQRQDFSSPLVGSQFSGSAPPLSPRHGPPATNPVIRGERGMQASGRGPAAAAARSPSPSPSFQSEKRSTARKSRLSQVAQSDELADSAAARAQSPNPPGPSSARSPPSTPDDLFNPFSQSGNPGGSLQRSKTPSPPRMRHSPFSHQ